MISVKYISLVGALALRALAIEDGVAPAPLAQGHIRTVALDAAGNRYLAGFFFGEVDFNPAAGLDAKISAGDSDLFLTKFNADGTYGWTRTFGGSGDEQAVAASILGNVVFVAGTFTSTDAGVPNAGGIDALVLAFDTASGEPLANFGSAGAQTFGGQFDDEATALVVFGKTVYLAGGFASTNATVGGAGLFASTGQEDAFVIALHAASGKPVAAFGKRGFQVLAGMSVERATGLAVSGRTLFVSGYAFANSTGIGKLGSLTGFGGLDAFVMAIDRKSGAPAKKFGFKGVQLVGGTGNDLAFSISSTADFVQICGTFDSGDAGVGGLGEALSTGGFDAFVATLNRTTGKAHPFFGISGLQTFGGSADDAATGIVAMGDRLEVIGGFTSRNAGTGGFGSAASAGRGDAFALQIDAFSGGAFGFDPVIFGGSADDAAFGVAAAGGTAVAVGASFSQNAGFGELGGLDAVPWNGFLLGLETRAINPENSNEEDSDGDDFPDEVEATFGTPPEEYIVSPAGFNKGIAEPLTVRSLSIALDFTEPDPTRDTVVVRGKVAILAGFAPTGEPVAVSIGGVVRRFVLNAQGAAVNGGDAFRVAVKKKGGRVPAQEASFTATIRRASLRAQLDDESLTGTATIIQPGEPRRVVALVLIGGRFFREDVIVNYVATAGQSGAATTP